MFKSFEFQVLLALVFSLLWNVDAAPEQENNSTRINRIVGGYRCDITQNPYMVAVFRSTGFRFVLKCGGTLVTKYYVLTASRCMENCKGRAFLVFAGTNIGSVNSNLNKNIQKSSVRRCFIFSDPTTTTNIGLLRLRRAILETNTVKYVQLAISKDKPLQEACKDALTMGWGTQYSQTVQGDPISYPLPKHDPYLQCLQTSIMSNSECVKRLEVDKMIADTFCAFTHGKDACTGDTGGPFMCNGLQYGVVLWSRGCAFKEYPGLFGVTFERKHETFINNTINENSTIEFNIARFLLLALLIGLIT